MKLQSANRKKNDVLETETRVKVSMRFPNNESNKIEDISSVLENKNQKR